MHLWPKANKGLTLVEVMIAIVVGAIVLMATTLALAAVHKMIVRARDHALVRQDIRVVTKLIRSSVRRRTFQEVAVEDDGTTLVLGPEGAPVCALKKVDRNLVRVEGQDSSVLIENRIDNLKFELVSGHAPETTLLTVTVTIALKNVRSTASFTTGFRNEMEI